ncbi:MAG: glutamate--tRNA ligase, partial [Planctomycetota bacterium]
MAEIVTRFAPSPTGYLHVGGARTALFIYLLAKNAGGKFLLRIEDTDQARSTDAAVEGVLQDMRWLGLDWDNADDLMYQSRRVDIYNKLFDDLIARGLAYEAWESREELDNQRKQAQMAKRPYLYRRPTYTDDQIAKYKDEGRQPVLRFAMDVKDYYFDDAVLGPKQGVDSRQVQDFVVRKADGMPTYHFAVVVDDNAMGITHVLRGQEHLLNTCQHIALMEALGYDRPTFAHLPVILKTDGSKMGKRDRDKIVKQAVRDYKETVKDLVELSNSSGVGVIALDKWVGDKNAQLDPA